AWLRPDQVAVVCAEDQLAYAELNAKANRIGYRLRDLGVGPECVVAICADRSLETVAAILGILKAGGAYVPLDPAYPSERLSFILKETRAPMLLTKSTLVSGLPESNATLLLLDTEQATLGQGEERNPFSGVLPQNLAYVIYTSGSTGRPKGVLIPHVNL